MSGGHSYSYCTRCEKATPFTVRMYGIYREDFCLECFKKWLAGQIREAD